MKRSTTQLISVGRLFSVALPNDTTGIEIVRERVDPEAVIAVEACASSHHWGRLLQPYDYEVRLVPCQFVKPFVKSNKNDRVDAEAIAEAGMRPGMRFVAVKSQRQQDLQALHRSYSRPRVSDNNPFSEALFRTWKYRPDYPPNAFADVHKARDWVLGFVRWYNHEHRHSSLRYVTPQERHEGRDKVILARRHAIYIGAKQANPRRWSDPTRNWEPAGAVWLNPEKALEAA